MPRTSLGDRLFRAVLRLFPAEFRGDFGDDMAADFHDQRRDAARAAGRAGVARLWARTLADFGRRAPREHAASLAGDARFAVRMMRRYAVSTVVIVLLLAIGIGANVAVLGFADPLLRRTLPVPAGEAVVRIVRLGPDGDSRFSHPFFLDLRDRSRTLAVAAHQYTTVAFGLGDAARSLGGELVSGNYFEVLGIDPALGRLLQPADDVAVGAHPVIVISHRTWREVFNGAADAIGRVVHLNGHAFEIVGVAPEGFPGSYTAFASRYWVPITMYRQARPQDIALDRRGWSWLSLTGRVRSGYARQEASAEVDRIASALRAQYPSAADSGLHGAVPARGLPESTQQTAADVLAFSGAIAVLLLVVTCANVAGVLQSRASARIRETAVRYALGATRLRVVRQWLTESVLLALLGAAAALAVARAIQAGLTVLLGEAAPMELTAPAILDLRILGATTGLAVGAGLLFGLLPAWRSASRGERTLREHAHSMAGSRWAQQTTRALVFLQVAVSVALLVTAGLLTRSLRNTSTFHPGFETGGLIVADLNLQRHGYDAARASVFFRTLFERLRARGEVASVTRATVVPLGGGVERLGFRIPGYRTPDGRTTVPIDVNAVGGGYFETMDIPVVRGRTFSETDTARTNGVVVVNETLAGRFWPGQEAVGQTISLAGTSRTMTVIGVVRDIKYYALDEQPRPYVYASAEQLDSGSRVVHIRAAGTPEAAIDALRREVRAIDPAVLVEGAMTFAELRQQPFLLRRAMMVIAHAFGVLALVLTLVGIYGTMSNAVGQRGREIGVRIAFGATARQVFGLVMRQGLVPVLLGIAGGVLASGLLARLIASELFGVSAVDPLTHAAAAAAVLAGASAALSIPATRAARLDPVAILRQ